ncbi:pilus assembly protein CpaB [Elusimicrobium posterum]|uniref:Flp pilus assembly protein CpaB n=1 Tax=Elusimicrobium posterum TaxID=3116653 RepID=UPI003C77176E
MKKALLILFVLVCLGVIVAVLGRSAIKKQMAFKQNQEAAQHEDRGPHSMPRHIFNDENARVPSEKVIVASRELRKGSLIKPGDLTYMDIAKDSIFKDAMFFNSNADIVKFERNFILTEDVARGGQILKSILVAKDEAPALPSVSKVPNMWRGYFLEVALYEAQALEEGSLIDILYTFEAVMRDGKTEPVTATLLQRIKVLDSKEYGDKGVLLLAIDPRDAQYLALAVETGSVRVILRNNGDLLTPPIKLATMSSIFN